MPDPGKQAVKPDELDPARRLAPDAPAPPISAETKAELETKAYTAAMAAEVAKQPKPAPGAPPMNREAVREESKKRVKFWVMVDPVDGRPVTIKRGRTLAPYKWEQVNGIEIEALRWQMSVKACTAIILPPGKEPPR